MGTRTGYAAGVGARLATAGNRPMNDAIRDSRIWVGKQEAEGRGQRSEDERRNSEVEGERDEVCDRKGDGTGRDFRVEFQ